MYMTSQVDKLSFYFNAWVSARRKSAKIIAFMEERELRYAAHCMRLWVGKLHQVCVFVYMSCLLLCICI
jgi:hypothetical protein